MWTGDKKGIVISPDQVTVGENETIQSAVERKKKELEAKFPTIKTHMKQAQELAKTYEVIPLEKPTNVTLNFIELFTQNNNDSFTTHNDENEIRGKATVTPILVRDFNSDESSPDVADWTILKEAAQTQNPTYIEPYELTGTWVHMDWG